MSTSTFVRSRSGAVAVLGPPEFYAVVRRLWGPRITGATRSRKRFLTWDDWAELFDAAERFGLIDRFEASGKSVNFRYGSIGLNLLETWRRVQIAQRHDLTSRAFHLGEIRRLRALNSAERERIRKERELARKRKTAEADARRAIRSKRPTDDDDLIDYARTKFDPKNTRPRKDTD